MIRHAALDHGCQLLPTLQTWAGMVLNGGAAGQRARAKEASFFNENEAEIFAGAAHLLKQLPYTCSELDLHKQNLLVQNLWACTSQSTVTKSTLMEYIKRGKRLDVEQAVAMVLAFVPAELGSKLAPLVSEIFISSSMWKTSDDFDLEDNRSLAAARDRKMTLVRDAVGASAAADDQLLVRVLMRVRRERSALSCSQRLCFPKYLIVLLPEEERILWSESYTSGLQSEVKIDSRSVVKVHKTLFARIQRWLWKLDGDKSEKAAFIREVRRLEKEIHCGHVQIDALETTEDPAALAFSFMVVQRRLQLKVVSDDGWSTFLKKGQGSAVLQNRSDIVTSFEQELARHATDVQALIAIRPPPTAEHSIGTLDELVAQVDRVCTLMEHYVLLFGDGLFENLRYCRIRKEGWKGRGPEDYYNLLVDLLGTLRERGNGRFTIGPCHKFLAKDIMAWNDAWMDDAFAPGKIPGWVEWLSERQKLRIHLNSLSK